MSNTVFKKVVVFILVLVLLVPVASVVADTLAPTPNMSDILQILVKASSDPTIIVPDSIKPLQGPFNKFLKNILAYKPIQAAAIASSTQLALIDISSPSKAKAVVSQLNKDIAQLNTAKQNKDNALGMLESDLSTVPIDPTIEKSFESSVNPLDSNDILSLDNDKHTEILQLLYAEKDFYTYLSQSKSHFDSLNGYMSFESSSDDYEYMAYLAKVRNIFKDLVDTEIKQLNFITSHSDLYTGIFGSTYMDQINANLKIDQQLKDEWAQVTSGPTATQTPSPTTTTPPATTTPPPTTNNAVPTDSQLSVRRKASPELSVVVAQIQALNDSYGAAGSYAKERFASKASLKKALSLTQSLLALYKKYDKIYYPILLQYKKDFPETTNYVSEVLNATDEDFKNEFISTEKNTLIDEGPQLDTKIYTLAIANWPNIQTYFDDKTATHDVVFSNQKANTTYIDLLNKYESRFTLYFSSLNSNSSASN